jgi:hypothetical protein
MVDFAYHADNFSRANLSEDLSCGSTYGWSAVLFNESEWSYFDNNPSAMDMPFIIAEGDITMLYLGTRHSIETYYMMSYVDWMPDGRVGADVMFDKNSKSQLLIDVVNQFGYNSNWKVATSHVCSITDIAVRDDITKDYSLVLNLLLERCDLDRNTKYATTKLDKFHHQQYVGGSYYYDPDFVSFWKSMDDNTVSFAGYGITLTPHRGLTPLSTNHAYLHIQGHLYALHGMYFSFFVNTNKAPGFEMFTECGVVPLELEVLICHYAGVQPSEEVDFSLNSYCFFDGKDEAVDISVDELNELTTKWA